MSMIQDDFVIAYDGTTVAEGGDYTPLPDGTKVLATILPTKKDTSFIEKRPMAKQGPNTAITVLAPRFRIADGQRGAGRNVFANVPLARSVYSLKKGGRTPAYAFFGFYRALGYDVDDPQGFRLPADHELLGKEIELVLGVEDDGKGGLRNNVKFFNKPNGIHAAPAGVAQPSAASTSQPAWTPPGATAPDATPEPPASNAAPWATPPAQPSALQQAAQSGQGF